MENVYTCSCGHQTFWVFDNRVRCTKCNAEFESRNTPVEEFNQRVVEAVELEEI